ncbi:NAD(P)/FAD-dependent oxidoreductase [Kitasatospora sp. NPDC059088]|uniref:NAD(P)/FAD-dependent oxidoreductase n=1 Tax=Kitasatospora sp. NPDC059088 TaxID=3346722 RepID=UPI0036AC4F5B
MTDSQLLIVGAGPAGCSAAIQAAGLGMTSIVVDRSERPGGSLWRIGNLTNMPGDWTDGPSYAESLIRHLNRLGDRCRLVQGEAVAVDASEDHASVALADGRVLTGDYLVVATGVRSAQASDVPWLDANEDLPPIWSITSEDLDGRTVVLGADRPLGTWLRTHPHFGGTLTVLHPKTDAYKADEVREDERVLLVPIDRVTVRGTGPFEVAYTTVNGDAADQGADTVVMNVGSVAASLPGLFAAADGYCPPAEQRHRITTAGDLRSRRNQRVQIAGASGAEAALAHYYGALDAV